MADAKAGVENLSVLRAAEEMASGSVVVLDVREPGEWEECIARAVQVPAVCWSSCGPDQPAAPPGAGSLREAHRVLPFGIPVRAGGPHPESHELGFAAVANLDGGFTAWKAAGLPIIDQHLGL